MKLIDLTYGEAMEALDAGQCVKLPEWHGHWFKKDGKVLVELRDGSIVDTPFTNLEHRVDWLVVDGLRDFSGILPAIKAGRKAARRGWNGHGMYVFMFQGYPVNGFAQPKLAATDATPALVEETPPHLEGQMMPGLLIRLSGDSKYWGNGFADYCEWRPTVMDLFADDWYIIRD